MSTQRRTATKAPTVAASRARVRGRRAAAEAESVRAGQCRSSATECVPATSSDVSIKRSRRRDTWLRLKKGHLAGSRDDANLTLVVIAMSIVLGASARWNRLCSLQQIFDGAVVDAARPSMRESCRGDSDIDMATSRQFANVSLAQACVRGGRMPAEAPEGKWYVLHTYSGYENKVKKSIETRVEALDLGDRVYEIVVPTQEEIEIRERSAPHRAAQGLPRLCAGADGDGRRHLVRPAQHAGRDRLRQHQQQASPAAAIPKCRRS